MLRGKNRLFRIDRRFVNLTGTKIINRDANDDPEVGAEGDFPDAAASAEAMVNEYLSVAQKEAKTKTEEILNNARTLADQIIEEARNEAEDERDRARQEGYEKGLEEGRHSFDRKLEEKIHEDDETLRRVLDEIHEERERTYLELEEEVASLALEIVRKIIHMPEEKIGDVFIPLIKNALRQMSTDGKIVIRVGPKEYERYFSSGAATLELDSGAKVTAAVLRDVSLQEGDCIIDTEDVTVNAGIDSQLQFVKLSFERATQYEPE